MKVLLAPSVVGSFLWGKRGNGEGRTGVCVYISLQTLLAALFVFFRTATQIVTSHLWMFAWVRSPLTPAPSQIICVYFRHVVFCCLSSVCCAQKFARTDSLATVKVQPAGSAAVCSGLTKSLRLNTFSFSNGVWSHQLNIFFFLYSTFYLCRTISVEI